MLKVPHSRDLGKTKMDPLLVYEEHRGTFLVTGFYMGSMFCSQGYSLWLKFRTCMINPILHHTGFSIVYPLLFNFNMLGGLKDIDSPHSKEGKQVDC